MAIDLSKIRKEAYPKSKQKKGEELFGFLKKDISFGGSQLSDNKKEAFYLELSTLLNAGIDIKSALEIIVTEQIKPKDRMVFEEIKKTVVGGSPISEAIKISRKFSNYEYSSLQIGEETGKISIVLKELSEFFLKKIQQKRQVTNALAYPAIVILTSIGAIALMMNTVVPMFSGIYQRSGAELPWITSVVISISVAFGSYFYWFSLVCIVMGYFFFIKRKQKWYRNYFSKLILRIPILGDLIRKIYLARFCNSMKLLLGSKVPLIRALALTRQTIGFYPIEVSLEEVERNIIKGASLHKSLELYKIYDYKMIMFIKIGEEINKLDDFFGKISNQYSEEVDHKASVLKNIIEPLIILFLGVIIAVILVAMYLPLFNLSTVF